MKTNEGKYATSHERWKTCNQYQGRKTCDPCQARENASDQLVIYFGIASHWSNAVGSVKFLNQSL